MKDFTLHIALTNVQIKDEKDFVDQIEEGCFKRHKENLQKNSKPTKADNLYEPFKYYIYGSYDIVFISLINNYDFAQKLFIPKFQKEEGKDNPKTPPYSYQIITGILSNLQSTDLSTLSDSYEKFAFLGICNFKLNNGFLVGNGIDFTEPVSKLIHEELDTLLGINGKYIVLHSFSWFEFSILIFANDPEYISKAIFRLRSQKIDSLKNDSIIKQSAKFNKVSKSKLDPAEIIQHLGKSDIFSDTQSYFCIQYDYYNKENNEAVNKIKLRTEIEWQVRPGHFSIFKQTIEKNLKGIFELDKISLITGKSDFVIDESSHEFENNYKIQQLLNSEINKTKNEVSKRNMLIEHVRNIKTKVYLTNFEPKDDLLIDNDIEIDTSFRNQIKYEINIDDYNIKLKKLKVSKQCRANVLKMFYHYKNGINDPVLSIYFFDFYYFMKSVTETIDERCKHLDLYFKGGVNSMIAGINVPEFINDVSDIESKLAKNFEIFDEAFNIRMLNSCRYEDISDINLEFNSSIQQLLTMYNTFVHVVGDIFKTSSTNFIVQINYRSTVANAKSINYSIYDLLTPEFIFYTCPKEILNYYDENSNNILYSTVFNKFRLKFEEVLRNIKSKNYNEYLHELLDEDIIDFDYLFIESIRFYFSFNLNKDCFIYWTWSYAFKNSSMYNISGSFGEANFKSELIRIIFTLKLYNTETSDLKCPLPQLETYWQRFFPIINSVLSSFFNHNKELIKEFKKDILSLLRYFTEEDLINYGKHVIPLSFNSSGFQQMLDLYDETYNEVNIPLVTLANYFETHSKNYMDLDDERITKSNLRLKMHMYLYYIYFNNKSDDGYINFLYRDWHNGEPLHKYNEITSEESISYFYRIDQMGGVFFPSQAKLEEYFILRNKLLVNLWDFAMRETNELIKKIV